jgi:class 3 adenylate cyclase
MADYTNRTFICSVLFLDIVEYSQRSVAEQIRLKEQFNAVLTDAISGVATDDRIILDTGDGAAVSFLGDPEDAMFAGLSLRDAAAGQDSSVGPRLQIRVGINLGPVRLVKDINGQPNIIGDGINVAQRVMNFAEPGQILVSRSYYDVMVRLSEDYAQLFHYEGAKTDKHVREHEVYAISTAPSSIRRTVPVSAPKQSRRLPNFLVPRIRLPRFRFPRVILRPLAAKLSVNSKLLIAAPLAFILIVSSGVIARGHRPSVGEGRVAASEQPKMAALPKTDAAAIKPAEPGPTTEPDTLGAEKDSQASPSAEPSAPPAKSSRRSTRSRLTETAKAPKAKDSAPAERSKPPLLTARAKDAAEAPATKEPEPPVTARSSMQDTTISVVALPWAEIYVDGTKLGVSPPLRSIPVRPGKHKVELRNSAFPAHIETVEAKSGTEVSIRHRFRR